MTILRVRNHVAAFFISLYGISKIEGQELGQCYFPGGAWDNSSRPCDPYAITTLCCPIGWTCFSNYACVVTDSSIVGSSFPLGTTIRGSCSECSPSYLFPIQLVSGVVRHNTGPETYFLLLIQPSNPLWNNGFCGSFCLDDPVSPPSANNGSLEDCGNGNWCCAPAVADGSCNCSSGKGTFSIPQGKAQTIIGVSGLQSTSTGFVTSTSATGITKTTSTGVSTTSNTSASKTTSASGTSRSSSTGTASTLSASGNGTVVHTPVTQTTGFKAGMSVGAVAVAAVLGFVAFILWQRWRDRRESEREFPTRPSSPAYTAVTSEPREPYNAGLPPRTYTAYNPGAMSTNYEGVPTTSPDPYRFQSQSPTLRDSRIDRPVSPEVPEYSSSSRLRSMASLPTVP
ncbi:uncharacterized protein PAC_03768 [Phialocephala subalpina]|uniref:Uncharacterized protein n=1 Tax=Phialocephala subalpina TaxID=576137 RepID=A0A1L7WMB7_9HELO|nr:uncharacterized protein PAC_03768 [Phialocephala subalpina]